MDGVIVEESNVSVGSEEKKQVGVTTALKIFNDILVQCDCRERVLTNMLEMAQEAREHGRKATEYLEFVENYGRENVNVAMMILELKPEIFVEFVPNVELVDDTGSTEDAEEGEDEIYEIPFSELSTDVEDDASVESDTGDAQEFHYIKQEITDELLLDMADVNIANGTQEIEKGEDNNSKRRIRVVSPDITDPSGYRKC